MASPNKEYAIIFDNLNGGINRYDPDYRLKANESPEMENLLWRNGMLCSRKGQVYLSNAELGQGFAAYERLWHGYVFAHIGEYLYCFVPLPETGDGTYVSSSVGDTDPSPVSVALLCSGIPLIRGTFFMFTFFVTATEYACGVCDV